MSEADDLQELLVRLQKLQEGQARLEADMAHLKRALARHEVLLGLLIAAGGDQARRITDLEESPHG